MITINNSSHLIILILCCIYTALDSADNVGIVTLCQADWELYKNIRLYAVRESPQAFGTTFEEELATTESEWKRRMGLNMLFAKKMGILLACVERY